MPMPRIPLPIAIDTAEGDALIPEAWARSLGHEMVKSILLDYTRKLPPQSFGSLEAEAFARYLLDVDLKVPHLPAVLAFEEATLATLADDQPRVVKFDIEPLPLLRALAEGRLPTDVGQAGEFEIELTADGSPSVVGAAPQSVEGAFPFH
ncbi:MAG TPA: hypothetical protein VKE96_32940 [Vicinamibacterales bacterium]|nr:hypothetical protein [Vicinamibacterales bacterium]